RRARGVRSVEGDEHRGIGHARDGTTRRARPPHPDGMMPPPTGKAILGAPAKEESMAEPSLDEMGPIDYIVLEWPAPQPKGEVAPLILDLHDRGIIPILDVALMVKGEDGSVAAIDLGAGNGDRGEFAEFEGASSGILGQEDLEEAAEALNPGTSAAV